MIRVGLAQVAGPNTTLVVTEVLRRCRLRYGSGEPQAAILLAGGDFDHRLILDQVRRRLPTAAVIGCTTAGVFSTGHGFSEDTVALMLLGADRIRMRAGYGQGLSRDPHGAVAAALEMAGIRPTGEAAPNRLDADDPPKLCLVMADNQARPFDEVLDLLNRSLPPSCPVFGGCAARLEESSQPARQFCHDQVLEDALVVLAFSGPVRHRAIIANSWRPIGPRARVTAATGRTVERIGDLKALDFYVHYLGEHEQPATDFPLAVTADDPSRVMLRTPLTYDLEQRSITFTTTVPVGAQVQLTEAARRFILADTERAAAALAEQVPSLEPAFVLAFSCSLRKEALGTRTAEELRLLTAHLPERLPILGYYGNGEIGPLVAGEASAFYNATLVALLVGEEAETTEALPLDHGAAGKVAAPARVQPDRAEDEELLCDLSGSAGFLCRIELLRKKLRRSERARRRLEDIKELHASLHRQVLEEAIAARDRIHRQEKKLRESETRFRRILETTGQGFVMMDRELVVQDCNPAYCRMLGYSREELIGRRPIDLMHPSYREFFIHNRDRILAQDSRELESALVTKDGRTLPILIHGNTLRDDEGDVIGHMAFITDMSVQKKALLLASEVQKGLLPQTMPTLEGLDIYGRSSACDEVGGDYFDFLYGPDFPNHRFSVVVGDVIGHGIDAALLMSSARAFLRMRASQPGSLAEVVTSLNRHLSGDVLESGRFMALFYCCIGADNRLLRWVRAGLDPALVYWPDRDAFSELMGEGTVLGLDGAASYQENVLQPIDREAILLLATDGIWEARDLSGEMFGKVRFKDTVRRHARRSAAALVQAVFAELQRFTTGTRPQDDRTLVVIKIRPQSTARSSDADR